MPVELPHLAMRSAPVHDYVYFTGGMVGIQFVEGWGLIPTREEGKPHAIGPPELTELLRIAEEANCGLVGFNQVVKTGESVPFETWRPAVAWQRNHLSGADSWDAIAQQARDAGDQAYAQQAASLSECLRAAGVRLRDASNSQLTQLKWALREGIAPDVFFTNAGIYPLYLALRALLAELRTARTCLGKLTGLALSFRHATNTSTDMRGSRVISSFGKTAPYCTRGPI